MPVTTVTSARKLARMILTAICTTLLLQACGDGDPAPQEPVLVPDERGRWPVSEGASPFHVLSASTLTTDGSAPTTVNTVHVVDLRSGLVVRRIRHDALALPFPFNGGATTWLTTSQSRLDADGRGSTALGKSQLVYLDGGRIMQLDLRSSASGTARRISALSACSISPLGATLNVTGDQAWLWVRVKPASGNCGDAPSSTTRLISLGAAQDDTGITPPPDRNFLLPLRDSSNRLIGILADNTSGPHHQLELWATDLSRATQVVDMGSSPPATTVSAWGPLQVFKDRQVALMQFGGALHRLSWRDGIVRLSAPLTTEANWEEASFGRNGDTVLASRGCAVEQIDAEGVVQRHVTVPGDAGGIRRLLLTPRHMVLLQQSATSLASPDGSTPTPGFACEGKGDQPPTLRVIQTATGAIVRTIPADTNDQRYRFFGHVGEALVLATQPATGTPTLLRLDLEGTADEVIATGLQFIDLAHPRHHDIASGDLTNSQLLWCAPRAGQTSADCGAGSPIQSYTFATRQTTTLGTMPAPATNGSGSGMLGSLNVLSTGFTADQPGILDVSVSLFSLPFGTTATAAPAPAVRMPLLLVPGVADSLTPILLTP